MKNKMDDYIFFFTKTVLSAIILFKQAMKENVVFSCSENRAAGESAEGKSQPLAPEPWRKIFKKRLG